MALRRLTSNRILFTANLIRSISAAPSLNRALHNSNHDSNHMSHTCTHIPIPPSFSNVFDPLAPSTRSINEGQLMNQVTDKCNPFLSESGIMGIRAARDVRHALHLNMYKYDGIKAGVQRSFSSSAESQVEQTKTAEKIQPNANILRPLSPHLPIYKPQTNSLASIFNRISAVYLSALFIVFFLLTMNAGPVCFTYYSFYLLIFYSSKFALISAELAALAMAYHLFHSGPQMLSSLSVIFSLMRQDLSAIFSRTRHGRKH